MSPDGLSSVVHDALRLLAILGAPLFAVILGVGLTIGVIQSATQVNDSSVSFVPKAVALICTLAFLGRWMVGRLAEFLVFAMQHIASGG